MKKLFLLVVAALMTTLWLGALHAYAQKVSIEQATEKAASFFGQPSSHALRSARKAPHKSPQLQTVVQRDEFYIFNDEANGGFVIVSGDERLPDILGYSANGHFDANDMPCCLKAWLEDYANQVKFLNEHPKAEKTCSEKKQCAP